MTRNEKEGSLGKILICDDSEICVETVKLLLEERGYEVVGLDTPFGFGAALMRERPDLVLLDVTMPALQGDQLVELARRQGLLSCPIVFFSDRTPKDLQALVGKVGAMGFILKTGDGDRLATQVENFLGRSRSARRD